MLFFKTKNSANQTQDSRQSKNSSMFQQGLSQSLVWQRVCADWVQPGWNMRGPRGSMKCA